MALTGVAMRCLSIVVVATLASTTAPAQAVDWKAVESAMGRPSVVQPGDVHRFNFPRSDMHVTAAGVSIKPSFALGGCVAMKAVPSGVVAMGDLVLGDNEMNQGISRLQAGGHQTTA